MKNNLFQCPSCGTGRLYQHPSSLICAVCAKEYTFTGDVPIILPDDAQQLDLLKNTQSKVSLNALRKIYNKAYEHAGLMGTDLDPVYDRVTKTTLLSFAEPLIGKRLLDVGTGVGKLWDHVPSDVEAYALDLSETGVHKALMRRPGLVGSVSVAEYLPYPDDFFDVVVAADTIEHTFSPGRALEEIQRVLVAGGVLAASFPIPNSLRKWGWNQLIRERPSIRFLARLAWVLAMRTVLFGRPDFQPIDCDQHMDEWINSLQQCGFAVERVVTWPDHPQIPIVYLIQAIRQ
jgi:ubiquinone/menaquinone biosynthesis C-methylase UbiE